MTRNALVIGATGGVGRAVVERLRGDGWDVDGLSRSVDGLDYRVPTSIDGVMDGVTGPYDLICVATGVLDGAGQAPEKRLGDVAADAMADQMMVNAIGPAMILRHAPRLLVRSGQGRFVALSARVGSIGDNALGGWYSYRAAKAALNQIIKTGAIELRRSHPHAACVAIHPGTVATPFTAKYRSGRAVVSPDVAARNIVAVIDGLTPDHTGTFMDYAGRPIVW